MIDRLRQKACEYGRRLRDGLVAQYREEFGVDVPPPPALIVDELITDIIGAKLHYDPLDLGVFAQTEWKYGRPVVTVNSRTADISGVKDVAGVQNVAKFHEVIHVDRDLDVLKSGPQLVLQGFEPPAKIVCHRGVNQFGRQNHRIRPGPVESEISREFWAEEAGRAAAISYPALLRSDAFRGFMRLGQDGTVASNRERWRLLYLASEAIGVNISALVKQLKLESQIIVQKEGGRQVIYPQPTFFSIMEGIG